MSNRGVFFICLAAGCVLGAAVGAVLASDRAGVDRALNALRRLAAHSVEDGIRLKERLLRAAHNHERGVEAPVGLS